MEVSPVVKLDPRVVCVPPFSRGDSLRFSECWFHARCTHLVKALPHSVAAPACFGFANTVLDLPAGRCHAISLECNLYQTRMDCFMHRMWQQCSKTFQNCFLEFGFASKCNWPSLGVRVVFIAISFGVVWSNIASMNVI